MATKQATRGAKKPAKTTRASRAPTLVRPRADPRTTPGWYELVEDDFRDGSGAVLADGWGKLLRALDAGERTKAQILDELRQSFYEGFEEADDIVLLPVSDPHGDRHEVWFHAQPVWGIAHRPSGTDLGDYVAPTAKDALRDFLADTGDKKLAPGVTATLRAPRILHVGVYRAPRDTAVPLPGQYLPSARRPNPTVGSELRKDRERAARAEHKKVLADLAKDIRGLKSAKGASLKERRARCQTLVRAAHQESRARFESIVQEARAERDKLRLEAKSACSTEKGSVRSDYEKKIRALEARQASEKKFQRDLRALEAQVKGVKKTRATASERRSEADDEVRHNIPRAHLPLYERVKRTLRPRPGESRTEAFERYVEEHPSEVLEAASENVDAEVAAMVAKEQARGRRRRA